MTDRSAPDDETMKGAAADWRPPPSNRMSGDSGVGVYFLLADLPLGLALHLASLPLDLLAGVSGQAAGSVAELAAHFLGRTLGLVLEPIRAEIVCHDCKSSFRWKVVLGTDGKAS